MTTHNRTPGGRIAAAVAVAGLAASMACHGAVTDALLVAQQPSVISPSAINTPAGATAAYVGALGRLESATAGTGGGSESIWMFGGLLADEYTSSSTFIQNDEFDERAVTLANSVNLVQFRSVNQVRTATNQAIPAMKLYTPTPAAPIAEMYMARGYAEMELADNYCNGIPLSDGTDNALGTPLTGTAVYNKALATLDSGRALLAGLTDANSVSILTALNVLKARVYVSLGDFTDAVALTGPVATTYSYDETYSGLVNNTLWSQATSQRRYNIGDTTVTAAGTVYRVFPALPFATAGDPRLGTVSNTPKGTLSQDGAVISRTTTLWTQTSSVPLVNGIDARLIEAEAFLKTGDVANWLATLNKLRASTLPLSAAGGLTYNANQLPALVDPGAAAANPQGTAIPARLYMTFYEKAMWTYGRGQRLSDMRRLIRQYAIPVTAVFPQGTHYRGPPYGPDVNAPVPFNEQVNPNYHGCIDRNA